MKVIGITGGVGAGKSQIAAYIKENYNARIMIADFAAHKLMEPGERCYSKIIDLFGEEIKDENHRIDRTKLADIVFQNKEKLQQLDEIVHPEVKEYIIQEIKTEREREKFDFFLVEAALLLEDHYETICDELWYIYADEQTRRKRLIASRGYTVEKIDAVFQNQSKEEVFRKACQESINNSNNFENTCRCIDRLLKKR